MLLTPREQEKLLITVAADLARRRRARGLKLNYPEAVALISSELLEGARDGRSVADLMQFGRTILTADDVMDGIMDDVWDPSDEVMGPDDPDWVPLEQHPVFAPALGWRHSLLPGMGRAAPRTAGATTPPCGTLQC